MRTGPRCSDLVGERATTTRSERDEMPFADRRLGRCRRADGRQRCSSGHDAAPRADTCVRTRRSSVWSICRREKPRSPRTSPRFERALRVESSTRSRRRRPGNGSPTCRSASATSRSESARWKPGSRTAVLEKSRPSPRCRRRVVASSRARWQHRSLIVRRPRQRGLLHVAALSVALSVRLSVRDGNYDVAPCSTRSASSSTAASRTCSI